MVLPIVFSVDSYMLREQTPEELHELQQADSEIGPILQALEQNKQLSMNNLQGKSRSYRLLLQQWNQLYIQNGLLFQQYEDSRGQMKWAQFVVPQTARK